MKTEEKLTTKVKQLHGIIAECKLCDKLIRFGLLTKEHGVICKSCAETKGIN